MWENGFLLSLQTAQVAFVVLEHPGISNGRGFFLNSVVLQFVLLSLIATQHVFVY